MMPRGTHKTRLICRHCGCNVGLWFYGWKHQTAGWRAPRKSCGRKLTVADITEVQDGTNSQIGETNGEPSGDR